jgi:hypothetical protein
MVPSSSITGTEPGHEWDGDPGGERHHDQPGRRDRQSGQQRRPAPDLRQRQGEHEQRAAVAQEHFTAVRKLLLGLARRTGTAEPRRLADRIELIIDGADTNAAAIGRRGAASASVTFARDVVIAATTTTPTAVMEWPLLHIFGRGRAPCSHPG